MNEEEGNNCDDSRSRGWYPAEPPDDEIYVIYSIGEEESQEWQAELLDYSFQKAGQPGTLIRLVSGDYRKSGRRVPVSAAGYTLVTPGFSTELRWPVMNKPGSLDYLFKTLGSSFKKRNRQSILIFLDPDMVFTAPWDPTRFISAGRVYGQRWIGYSKPYCLNSSTCVQWCPGDEEDSIMYPFGITMGDMEQLAPDIAAHAREGYRKCGDWMTDMTAFVTAMKQHRLQVTASDSVGLCNNWDNRDDADAPILHYCQSIEDAEGETLWSKLSYQPWDSVPDPSLATNRVDREVLSNVIKLRQIKNVLGSLAAQGKTRS